MPGLLGGIQEACSPKPTQALLSHTLVPCDNDTALHPLKMKHLLSDTADALFPHRHLRPQSLASVPSYMSEDKRE